MLQFTRTKTNEPHVWAINLLGHRVGTASADYSSETRRSWGGGVSLPLTNGKQIQAQADEIFSVKRLFKELNGQLKKLSVKDINFEDLTENRYMVSNGTFVRFAADRNAAKTLAGKLGKGYKLSVNHDYVEPEEEEEVSAAPAKRGPGRPRIKKS